jgi:hypothetical protein
MQRSGYCVRLQVSDVWFFGWYWGFWFSGCGIGCGALIFKRRGLRSGWKRVRLFVDSLGRLWDGIGNWVWTDQDWTS